MVKGEIGRCLTWLCGHGTLCANMWWHGCQNFVITKLWSYELLIFRRHSYKCHFDITGPLQNIYTIFKYNFYFCVCLFSPIALECPPVERFVILQCNVLRKGWFSQTQNTGMHFIRGWRITRCYILLWYKIDSSVTQTNHKHSSTIWHHWHGTLGVGLAAGTGGDEGFESCNTSIHSNWINMSTTAQPCFKIMLWR